MNEYAKKLMRAVGEAAIAEAAYETAKIELVNAQYDVKYAEVVAISSDTFKGCANEHERKAFIRNFSELELQGLKKAEANLIKAEARKKMASYEYWAYHAIVSNLAALHDAIPDEEKQDG